MADKTIPQLTALGANVAAGDLLEIADVSNADASRKVTQAELVANLGTPATLVGTNITGTAAGLTAGTASAVAVGGITGLGANVATFLATPSSANLRSAVTDESGTGALLFAGGALGTPASGVGTNLTGIPISTGLTGAGTGVLAALAVNANASGGLIILTDPGADRLTFWDDSAGAFAFLTVGTGLQITGTTIEATGAGGTAVTAASAAAGAGLLWISDGADRSAVATDTITTINATTAVVTNLNPVSNDGAPLGTAALSFSDLFLASGALINFANGNAVITHSSGILTVSTGDLRVTTAGTNAASAVTVGGTQTLTNKTLTSPTLTTPALGTPSSGTLTNCTGLPASGIAAGVLGGNITLGESTGQIILDPTLSADGTWSGIMQSGTAGATLAFGDLIYLAAADSRWELADADAASTSGDVVLGMCVLAAASDGDPTNVLLYGKIRADAAFPALTIGAPAYAGTTAGDIQTAQPSGTDDVIRVVGYGLTADVLLFNPSGFYITHT